MVLQSNETYMDVRYGLSFEDIELLEDYIESIDERGIIEMQEFSNLPQKVKG